MSNPPLTNIYVDGFNLYYGAAKHTPYKWIDVAALCRNTLAEISINRIRYFTALVKNTSEDPQKRQRQEAYIRALETIPRLTVHYGHFLQSDVSMRLSESSPGSPTHVRVRKMEEKGSDVNIATYMLVDAFRKDRDQLIVITNDSDLAEPIRIINRELGLAVGVFNPHTEDTAKKLTRITGRKCKASPSVSLRKVARFVRDLDSEGPSSVVARSQFPVEITDQSGRTIHRPEKWRVL